MEMDEQVLNILECPVCMSTMKRPIYQCKLGHSICHMCKPRLERCPTCRSAYGITRNYSLEGLAAGVQHCVYHDLGCSVTAFATRITKHEKVCAYKTYNCPIQECNSKGNHLEIILHLIYFHPECRTFFTFTPGYQEILQFRSRRLITGCIHRCYFIALNHIFRLSCQRVAEHCLWAVEIIGYYCENKTFAYEVSILSITGRCKENLTSSDYCLVNVSEDELFKKCVKFHDRILTNYCCYGDFIVYRVDIKEM